MKTKLKSILAVALCAVGLAAFAEPTYYKLSLPPVVANAPKPPVSALSNVFALDLTPDDRIAKDVETIVADPAWGNMGKATVKFPDSTVRTYTCASNDLWDTTALEPGRHVLILTAWNDNYNYYTAIFWKPGEDWVVFDCSNITADVTFEPGKTYLILGKNTLGDDVTLTVKDGVNLMYPRDGCFSGGKVAELPKRYRINEGSDGYTIDEKLKGCEDNPWVIGDNGEEPPQLVEAWTNGTEELVIVGTGTIKDIYGLSTGVKEGIKVITISEPTVMGAKGDVFFHIGSEDDRVQLSLPDNWQGKVPDDEGTWYGAYVDTENFVWPKAVKNLTFRQRYPWNGLVDISCGLTGAGVLKISVTVLTNDVKFIANPTLEGETVFDLFNLWDGGEEVDVRLIWDAAKDLPAGFKAKNVKVKVTAEQIPPPAGQLWRLGPIWSEGNFGTSEAQGHPEYGALYTFDDATNAVAQLKDGSRLPYKEELADLFDPLRCDCQWDDVRKGYLFTGKGVYKVNSVFLPAAGYDVGNGTRRSGGIIGEYWSSAPDPEDDGNAWALELSEDGPEMTVQDRSYGLSVRTVKDEEE